TGLPQGRAQVSVDARIQEPHDARDPGDSHTSRGKRRSRGAVRRQGSGSGAALAGDPGSRKRRLRRRGCEDRRDPNLPGHGVEGTRAETAGQAAQNRSRKAPALRVSRAPSHRVCVRRTRRRHRGAAVFVMMRLPAFSYVSPTSVVDAARLMADNGSDAMLVAGGTDLFPNMKRRQFEPKVLVGLRGIKDLTGIRGSAGTGVTIGSGTTLTSTSRHEEIARHYPALATAAGLVSTPQLRNMGTLGGNICVDTRCNYYNQSYQWRKAVNFCMKKDGDICLVAPGSARCWAVSSSDTAPVLWSLGATVRLLGPAGEREIPIATPYRDDGIEYLAKRPDQVVTE